MKPGRSGLPSVCHPRFCEVDKVGLSEVDKVGLSEADEVGLSEADEVGLSVLMEIFDTGS